MPAWKLPRLHTLSVAGRNLTLEPNWSSGENLQKLDLRCYRLCIDTEWVPESNLFLKLQFGPVKAREIDSNSVIRLLNTWKGINIEYEPILWQGEDCQKVKATHTKRQWESCAVLLTESMRYVIAVRAIGKRHTCPESCVMGFMRAKSYIVCTL